MSELANKRLALVGVGGWGGNIAAAAAKLKNATVAWVVDRDEKRQSAQRGRFKDARFTGDLAEALADNTLDAVLIATPSPTHEALGLSALAAGKDVYVEKPMALTTAGAEKMVQAARAGGRVLMVGHLLKYHPALAFIKKIIDEGTLGDVLYMYNQRVNLGVIRTEENALWSLAPHDISVVLWLFGETPCRVSATGHAYLQPGIEDVVFSSLTFPSGRMAHIQVSWLDPHKERRMTSGGPKAMVHFDDMSGGEKVRLYHKGVDIREMPGATGVMEGMSIRSGDIVIPKTPGGEPLLIELQHFVDRLHDRAAPLSDGVDGLNVVRILEALSLSLKQNGQPVDLG